MEGKPFEMDESLRIKFNFHGLCSSWLAEDMDSKSFGSASKTSYASNKEPLKCAVLEQPIKISEDESDEESEIDFLSEDPNSDEELARESSWWQSKRDTLPKPRPVSPRFYVSALLRPPVGGKPLPAASPRPAIASSERRRQLKPPKPVSTKPVVSPKNSQPLRIQPAPFPVSPMSPELKLINWKALEEDESDNDTPPQSPIEETMRDAVPVPASLLLDRPRFTSEPKAIFSHGRALKRASSTEKVATLSKKRRLEYIPYVCLKFSSRLTNKLGSSRLSYSPPLALSYDDNEDDNCTSLKDFLKFTFMMESSVCNSSQA